MSLLHMGLDIGSTTAKIVLLDKDDHIIHSRYNRHFSSIHSAVGELMNEIRENYGDSNITIAVAGSGALAVAEGLQIPFTQELIACNASIGRYLNGVDVCIELGGEDAKLTFFDPSGIDQRMNETCAGGTGAFLDQMATLLGTDAAGLNELAKGYSTIYPIASRCGVFAKTDIQPLLNDGAAKSDIAASIFQAIVNQTISGLACGRKITGNVAFLGGPLYFLSELRVRFAETLELTPEQCIFPDNPHLFVAMGAAILGKKNGVTDLAELHEKALRYFAMPRTDAVNVLPALFIDEEARNAFKERHSSQRIAKRELKTYKGDAYVGIDVGSTTTKLVLISDNGELLFSRYRTNGGGEPLIAVKELLLELYSELPASVTVRSSGVTGYGEKLVQAALGVDVGEVETVAHARAADFILPGVDFVIDIGGQDMKCLNISDGAIGDVFLNEACSSGCGSFLQSFADSLGMSMEEFAASAEESMMPVDLGSRCTVFMNSRVRQAQKEGALVKDISAGLAYSVVRNALYKVLKIRSNDDLGAKIVVQGGAFKNDSLLRAFELITGREVVRPRIPELMGAFGVALIARETKRGTGELVPLAVQAEPAPLSSSSLLGMEALKSFSAESSASRCKGCGNRCMLTHTRFADGSSYISGNRCEHGNPSQAKVSLPPNIFEQKYRRLFKHYRALPEGSAVNGVIGIPRALNIYENYPFWFTLFTELGFRVELSSPVPDVNGGIDTIPSQTVCYPAKVAHRHIFDLLKRGVNTIFYPIMQKEQREFKDAHQNFNCPVVIGYPDVLYLNIDELKSEGVNFIRAVMPIDSERRMVTAIIEALPSYGLEQQNVKAALSKAYSEQEKFKNDIAGYGRDAIAFLKQHGGVGIVLAGHPYHLDPEVNHGIPELINQYGVAVFTEDSICGRAEELKVQDTIHVLDQWVYHSRLYRTASVVARHPDFKDVHMVQLNSFGCGLDAVSADQAADILERHGKPHTLLKIDEGKNSGAVRIRIRSLLASIKMRKTKADKEQGSALHPARGLSPLDPVKTTERTILCPPLSSHHFQFLETAMRSAGYDFRVLPEGSRDAVELALKYVNNDVCYPVMLVVGQFLHAFKSGAYSPDTTDCFYAQTGGICRASNYVPLLRRALDAAGYSQVRILAANAQKNSGAERFTFPAATAWRTLLGLLYGDLMMKLSLRTRPYEMERGSTDALYSSWVERCRKNIAAGSWSTFKKDVKDMVQSFTSILIDDKPRPRVGIVGEILVKYHTNANERLIEIIEGEGGEAVVPDLANFMLYCLFDLVYAGKKLSGGTLSGLLGKLSIGALERLRNPIREALRGTRFGEVHDILTMADSAETMVSHANQAGEGWLLTAEMMHLIESGIKNVLCIQPFACLPNHITGKGVIKELKRRYGGANVMALDYDSGVSTVNQLNRIKLLMATARA